jgi:chromosome segregation ATPase
MSLFLSIVIPTLISVIIILYFRRSDRRNTQLQTLKAFINNAVNNMNHIFHEKEKELKDKTISLDIALKKLDKASAFINNKMAEIGGSIKQITALRQEFSGELKEAAEFNRNVAEIRNRLVELTKATTEVEALKKEIGESKKSSMQIKSDIEQSRVWAEDNINDAMKKTLDDIALQKSQSVDQIRKMQEDIDSRQKEVDSLNNKLAVHGTAVQEMNAKLGKFIKEVTDKFKAELSVIKNSAGNETDKFVETVAKKEANLKEMIQTLQDDLSKAVGDVRDAGRESMDSIMEKISEKETSLDKSIDDAQEKMDSIHEMIDKKFDATYKELMEKEEYGIENLKNTIRATIEKVKESAMEDIQEVKTEISDLGKDITEETRKMKELERTIADEEKSLDSLRKDQAKSVESLQDDFQKLMARNAEDGMEKIKASALEGMQEIKTQISDLGKGVTEEGRKMRDLEREMADYEKSIESMKKEHFRNMESLREEYQKLMVKNSQEGMEKLESLMEEFKGHFKKEFDEYVKSSSGDYEGISDRIKQLIKSFKETEEEAVSAIQDRTVALETDFTRRINDIANNFDGYIKKTEEELENTLDNSREEIRVMVVDLNAEKKDLKETVLSDLKDLNKRTKEIESRYDGLVKKNSIIEKAEDLADRSDKNIKMMTQFLKELDGRKKETDTTLKNMDSIRSEYKALDTMISGIAANKKESQNIYNTVSEALEKAKDAQEILGIIEKQYAKVDDVKAVLIETLKIYDEIKNRIADAEKKRDIINGLIDSVDTAKDDIKVMDEKVSLIEDKVSTMNKVSKKIEEDVRAAQGKIEGLFHDQDRIGSAVDKIADIENLLIHIDEEGKKVQKMREWVAKLETQLERIKDSQEGTLGTNSSARKASAEKGSDEDTTKNILRLKEQGWSVDDISKSLKMSRAYVELIIERYEE